MRLICMASLNWLVEYESYVVRT